ncbi:MAG: MBL fold metallo-hydrolase [Puniceicoccales bacterium]|jgi:beta-lactamase superfamily II metal-dependent hydrolase|nr:MBL fold metallo-hydrolase [Puniceicoccales bacterium]
MKKVLLFIGVICVWLEAIVSGSNLEVNIFSVGVGNFVLLRKDNNVLVIDCGGASYIDKGILRNVLGGSESCTVVITHKHEDHYTAARVLRDCFRDESRGDAEFFHGWFSSNEEILNPRSDRKRIQCRSLPNDPGALSRCLGDDVSIHCLVPGENVESAHPHINNLVIGIKYGDVSFVFPGDANQDWLSENCERLEQLINELGGVNFLLIPHHGSMSDTGFFMKNAIEHFTGDSDVTSCSPLTNAGKRLMCVISSDPSNRSYSMPRKGVQCLFSSWCQNKVRPHSLSLAEVDPTADHHFRKVVVIENTTFPVFSTADTINGYKIVCNRFGFWMYERLGIGNLKVFDSLGFTFPR